MTERYEVWADSMERSRSMASVCRDCGALVVDQKMHDFWHLHQHEKLRPDLGMDGRVCNIVELSGLPAGVTPHETPGGGDG